MEDKTLLVIVPNQGRDRVYNIVHAESGESLASHLCSNEFFAFNDLYGQRELRKKEWTERFGELEVKFLKETDLTEEIIIERNKTWYEDYQKSLNP